MRILLAILVATLLAVPRISAAQAPVTQGTLPDLPRMYVDVNLFGHAYPLGNGKTFETYEVRSGEVATFKATYPEPSGSGVFPAYVGGGFMLTRKIAVGLSYSRISRNSEVNLEAQVPHPTFFNALASAAGSTGATLSGTESAVHVSLGFVPVRSKRVEVRLTAGPSFFTLTRDMTSEVQYEQTFNSLNLQNNITINGMSSREISGSKVGYHVGTDVTYFVHRLIGIAGGVRYGRATVAVDAEPLSKIKQEFLVGSTTVFLGLRVRLGRATWNE